MFHTNIMSTNVYPRFRINVLYICIVKGINNFVTLVKHNVNNFYLLHQFEPMARVFDRTSPGAVMVDTRMIDAKYSVLRLTSAISFCFIRWGRFQARSQGVFGSFSPPTPRNMDFFYIYWKI